ncbi:MAG: hypothetical protein M3R46_10310 [Actinomycetota bacterium]|nr:hypothetical protein [Actinomycetota bacterium]
MTGFKSLLLKFEVRSAGRKSRCSHNKNHEILKGEPRVVVKAPGVATPEKGYCAVCGRAMIERAREALLDVERDLKQ